MKYNIKLIDLQRDKIDKAISHYLDLQEDKFIYHIEGIISREPDAENDDYESFEEVYILEHTVLKKELLCGVSLFTGGNGLYTIDLELNGNTSVVKMNFDDLKEAKKLYNKIFDYIFPKKSKKNESEPIHDNL